MRVLALCLFGFVFSAHSQAIRIGELNSYKVFPAFLEPYRKGMELALEEINAKGGVLGRPLQPVVVDPASNWDLFAEKAKQLLLQDRVAVVFGCWTSVSRKSVLPVFESNNGLLFYPVQYEGLEQSPNIVYLGAAPNQQILPAVKYVHSFLGKRKFFLAGSDYVFPRTANAIIRDEVQALGGEVVGEEYLLLGSADVAGLVDKIKTTQPQVILNTLNPASPGTRITESAPGAVGEPRAVASKKGITVLMIAQPRMLMAYGFLARVFEVFNRQRTPVDLIATSEVSVSLTIDDTARLASVRADLAELGEVAVLPGMAIVSLVGRGFTRRAGLAGRIFSALEDVNVVMISFGASDVNISFVVAEGDAERAVRLLHRAFFE